MNFAHGPKSKTTRATAPAAKTPDQRVHGARLEVDRRAGQRPGTGQALEEPAAEVGQPFGQALPIVIQRLAGLVRNGLGNRQGFQQTQAGHRQGTARHLADPFQRDLGKVRQGQSRRDFTDDRD